MYLCLRLGDEMSEEKAALPALDVGQSALAILVQRVDVPGIGSDVLVIVEEELRKLAAKSDNSLDDALVDFLMPLVRMEVDKKLKELWGSLSAPPMQA